MYLLYYIAHCATPTADSWISSQLEGLPNVRVRDPERLSKVLSSVKDRLDRERNAADTILEIYIDYDRTISCKYRKNGNGEPVLTLCAFDYIANTPGIIDPKVCCATVARDSI